MNTYENNLVTGKQSLFGLLNGIKIAASAVKGTLGAAGTNAVIEQDFMPFHIITNDGATIIENIELEDPLEKRGLAFLKEAVDRSNKSSGDGSSTTVVLLESILEEGIKTEATGMEIKRSLDELVPVVESVIDQNKKNISEQEIKHVATISAESEEIGDLLGEIYSKIGKSGIIHPEYVLGKKGFAYELIEGVRFAGTGFLSPMMVRDENARKENRKETKAIYENPAILVTKRKIQTLNDINPLLETLSKMDKKDLVIFADDMDSGVASAMIAAHQSKLFNILIVKAPVLWKNYVYEDFAKCTGATIVEDSTGVNFKNLRLDHLGTCEKLVVDKDDTVIIGGKDLSEHISELEKEGSNDSLLRLSWLTTKTVLLKVGATSDTELSYLRLKIEDAINACRLALEDGVVVGAGMALVEVANNLPDTLGGRILKNALKSPAKQIVYNANGDVNAVDSLSKDEGFNAVTGQLVNLWDSNIIDPSKVVKNAFKNAISIASTILTSYAVIHKPRKSPEQLVMDLTRPRSPF